MNTEHVEEARGEWEQDGFYLYLGTDEGERLFRVTDTTVARELMRAVAPLLGWVADEDRERAAYDRASPEERQAVIGRGEASCGHDGWQAGCEQCEENARAAADWMRKAEREGR